MSYYITSPIYYVNDKPHIGHAYTTAACDVLARFYRLKQQQVRFMTGVDEHGQKIERSAAKLGIEPSQFVDEVSQKFVELADALSSSHDVFLRTTSAEHKAAVNKLWDILVSKGHIYLGKYKGWYSSRDEAFYQDSELDSNKLAPSGSPVEWVEEDCYFFDLSKWQDKLLAFYEANPGFVRPAHRLKEVVNFVAGGLHDLAVSRTGTSWGIKVPGNEAHVIYVWVDALTSYLSAVGGFDQDLRNHDFWPAYMHIVGKDILRFHAVYWPALLMAADLPLPRSIFAHGWWTNEGVKMSKSLGNTVDPMEVIDQFGAEYLRYFLLKEVGFGNDGNFSQEQLIARVNNELCNKIGNLCQRVLHFIFQKFSGQLTGLDIKKLYATESLLTKAENLPTHLDRCMQEVSFQQALEEIIHLAEQANQYIDTMAPWKLVKHNLDSTKEVLLVLCEVIRYIAIALQPFLPELSAKMLDQLGVVTDCRCFEHMSRNYALESVVLKQEPRPIFPKIC